MPDDLAANRGCRLGRGRIAGCRTVLIAHDRDTTLRDAIAVLAAGTEAIRDRAFRVALLAVGRLPRHGDMEAIGGGCGAVKSISTPCKTARRRSATAQFRIPLSASATTVVHPLVRRRDPRHAYNGPQRFSRRVARDR